LLVHLRGGPAAAYAFKHEVETRFNIDVPFTAPIATAGVQKSMHLYAAALWLVAALLALAGLAIVGQTLARQISLDAIDYPSLRAIGMTRGELFKLGFGRAALIAVGATPIAVVTAYLLSPFAPIGAARIAEPSPGFAFDVAVIGVGVGAAIVSVIALAIWPSLRSAKVYGSAGQRYEQSPSRIAASVARSSFSPSAGIGLRMALERGRGRTAVPVWSTIVAVAIGLAAVTATLTVGRSLTNLINSPGLAGLTYDAIVPSDSEDPHADEVVRDKLLAMPFVESTASGNALNIDIKGIDSFLVAFKQGDQVTFAMIRGRAPGVGLDAGLPEIALGPATMRRLRLRLGDTTAFIFAPSDESGSDVPKTQQARVVGVAAIPTLPWAAVEPGEGGVMTLEAMRRFGPDSGGCCFVKFKPGTDLASARTALEKQGLDAFPRTSRADLVTLERITNLPVLLSIAFGLMSVAALAHVLVTGIRRRRRDLAVLKTLGFVTKQVRGAIAWQSSTIVVLCALVGIPAGIGLGRWAWGVVADQFGVVPVPSVPILFTAIALPGAIFIANLIAVLPGRAAARTQPAVVLRSE